MIIPSQEYSIGDGGRHQIFFFNGFLLGFYFYLFIIVIFLYSSSVLQHHIYMSTILGLGGYKEPIKKAVEMAIYHCLGKYV